MVVQLGILVTTVATEVEDGPDLHERDAERFKWLGRVIDRIALSCIVVVAREAGVDLTPLDLWDVPKMHAPRFAGMGGVA